MSSRPTSMPAVRRALVLMYHRVTTPTVDPWSLCVSPEHLGEQLDVLQRWMRPIPLSELWTDRPTGDARPCVVVTFDDGYADNLHAAAPLLQRAGVPATVFVTTSAIDSGREFWWDELEALLLSVGVLPSSLDLDLGDGLESWQLGDAADYTAEAWRRGRGWRTEKPATGSRQEVYLALWRALQTRTEADQLKIIAALHAWASRVRSTRPDYRTLSVSELKLLAELRGIEIGAHTVTHPVLSLLPAEAQSRELRESKAYLESILGRPVASLSYPYGSYSQQTTALAQELGYSVACTTRAGLVDRSSTRFAVPRVQVEDWSGFEFEERLEAWLTGGVRPRVTLGTRSAGSAGRLGHDVMQTLWIGGPLSVIGRLSLQSFIGHGHQVHLYCYEPVEGVPAGVVVRDAGQIMPLERFLAVDGGKAGASDGNASQAFRYQLLFERGGWWIDTDVVCLQPFDFGGDSVFASEPADASYGGAAASPGVIKQPPGSALMRWASRMYRSRAEGSNEVEQYLLHRGIHAFGWQEDICQPAVFNPIARDDWRAFTDPDRTLTFGPEVHAVHLWEGMWREHGLNPDGPLPEGCFFEQLKRVEGRSVRSRRT